MDVRGLAAVVGVLAVLSLTGCAGDEEPGARKSSAPTVTPTPTPTSTETVTTPPADETAEEFIRRWFQAQEDMQNSGDSSAYVAMAPQCLDCRKVADRIQGIYSAGGSVHYEGHDVVRVVPRGEAKLTFEVRLKVGETEYSERSGAPEARLRGGTDDYAVTLAGTVGDWRVTHLLAIAG